MRKGKGRRDLTALLEALGYGESEGISPVGDLLDVHEPLPTRQRRGTRGVLAAGRRLAAELHGRRVLQSEARAAELASLRTISQMVNEGTSKDRVKTAIRRDFQTNEVLGWDLLNLDTGETSFVPTQPQAAPPPALGGGVTEGDLSNALGGGRRPPEYMRRNRHAEQGLR